MGDIADYHMMQQLKEHQNEVYKLDQLYSDAETLKEKYMMGIAKWIDINGKEHLIQDMSDIYIINVYNHLKNKRVVADVMTNMYKYVMEAELTKRNIDFRIDMHGLRGAYYQMIEIINENKQDGMKDDDGTLVAYRWVASTIIAHKLNMETRIITAKMKKLHKAGMVECRKKSGILVWSPIRAQGFKYCRSDYFLCVQ